MYLKVWKATVYAVLFVIAFSELMAAPVKLVHRFDGANEGKSLSKEEANSSAVIGEATRPSNETVQTYLPAQTPCRLRTFSATLNTLNLGHVFAFPKAPITFAFCEGSCDPPYSLDARVNNYVTDDVLFRQMADLQNVPISNDEKKKFKTPCCVPVEYTGLSLGMVAKNATVKWQVWSKAIPSKCGCR